MVGIDSLDRQILYELDVDSRQHVSALAKKLNAKPDTISARIKRMAGLGIIRSFRPVINVYNLGYSPYRLNVRFGGISEKEKNALFRQLSAQERVGWLVSSSGRWSMSVVLWAKDIYDFQKVIGPFLRKYGRHIEKKKMAVVHKLYLYSRCCLLGDEAAPGCKKREIVSEGKPAELDETDWRLLGILNKDSRASTAEIARELGMGPASAASRINSLIKREVIHGFRISPDHGLLGIKYYKVYFGFTDYPQKRLMELEKYVRENPFVVYIDEAFGGGDLEVEFQVNEESTFLEALNLVLARFSDIIGNYEVITFNKEYKFRFMPPSPYAEKDGKGAKK